MFSNIITFFSNIRSFFSNIKHKFLFIFLLFTTILLTLSLLGFSTYDHILFYDDSEKIQVTNWLGTFGAFWASLLVYFFGDSALIFLILTFFSIFCAFKIIPWKAHLDHLFGTFLFLISSSTFLACKKTILFFDTRPGGLLGNSLHNLIIKNGFLVQENFILFLSSWLSLILIFRFSWARPVCSFLQSAWARFLELKPILYLREKINLLKEKFEKIKQYFIPKTVQKTESLENMVQEIITGKQINENISTNSDPIFKQLSEWKQKENITNLQNVKNSQNQKSINNKNIIEENTKIDLYVLPGFDLFSPSPKEPHVKESYQGRINLLEKKLEHFGIYGKVTNVTSGPIVTLFEYRPRVDIKISSIIAREDDLALALQAISLRIIAPIPGESVIGFEVANRNRKSVLFSDCIKDQIYANFRGSLPIILGKNITGTPYILDLPSLPHLLLAGSTGSGKSVALHTILISLLYCAPPEHLKLILVDPKRVEFGKFVDLPHLLFPIQVEVKEIILTLNWAATTMDERYNTMASTGTRDIFEYQEKFGKDKMPFIVIVIDELADLMMMGGKDIEFLIVRIAQKARAAGIYLILATQRPSVDVITGLIKVNFSARAAFKVASKIDSRVIIDAVGAEKLVGKGDMLFVDAHGILRRIHGSYISQQEIERIVSFIKQQKKPDYVNLSENLQNNLDENTGEDGKLLKEIRLYLKDVDEVSISLLQRKFRIGFNRSARIIEQLSSEGLILPSKKGKNKVVH